MSRRIHAVREERPRGDRRRAGRRACARPTAISPMPAPTASTARRSAGGRCATSASPISRPADPAGGARARQGAVRGAAKHDRRAGGAVGAGRHRRRRSARRRSTAFYRALAGRPAGRRQMVRAAGALVVAGHDRGGAGADRAPGFHPQQPEPAARADRHLLARPTSCVSTTPAAPAMRFLADEVLALDPDNPTGRGAARPAAGAMAPLRPGAPGADEGGAAAHPRPPGPQRQHLRNGVEKPRR